MAHPIRVLIIEDCPDDAELLARELSASGCGNEFFRVETLEQMEQALTKSSWNVILADYKLSNFTALDALELLKRSGHDIPFIIVSGSIGEETAVEAMKAGAHDFFLKDHLTRLSSAIQREIREATLRQERRETERALRESESRKSAMLTSAFDGIIAIDKQDRIIEFNPAAEKMFGFTREEVLGRDVADFIMPIRFRERHQQGLIHYSPTKQSHFLGKVISIQAQHRSGAEFPVELAVTVAEEQQPPVFIGYIRDISERRRIEAERAHLLAGLKQAIQARDEFLAIASHELKTPITSLELQIESALQLLQTQNIADIALAKLLSKLEGTAQQVERLTMLINNLLDVTRITAGQQKITRTKVDLQDLAKGVLMRLQQVIKRSGSQIIFHANAPVVGHWDPIGIETVLSNIVSNAIKFGESKPIELTIESQNNTARFTVKDHGLGIAQEDQSRLFERFERAVPSQHYGGLGLGLWIARNIVEAHDGTIQVESQKGVGSTFIVKLPLTIEGAPI